MNELSEEQVAITIIVDSELYHREYRFYIAQDAQIDTRPVYNEQDLRRFMPDSRVAIDNSYDQDVILSFRAMHNSEGRTHLMIHEEKEKTRQTSGQIARKELLETREREKAQEMGLAYNRWKSELEAQKAHDRKTNREVKRLKRGNILSYLIHKEKNDA